MQDIRHILIHSPGPNWKPGAPIFEQEGVQQHVEFFRALLKDGRIEMGGPFLDPTAGGMMIPTAGQTEAQIVAFANADPAVASGLLQVEVRPWLVGMKR